MLSRLVPWLSCAMCAVSALVHAQPAATNSIGGSIGGYVYDQQRAALANVTIRAASPDVPGVRQTTSTATGSYHLTDLPPGTYTLTAEHPGFARYSQPNIRVGAGLNLGLEIVLQLADVAETVVVRHSPPMLEILRPGQTNNVSGDFQRALPLNRNGEWAQFMNVVPGTTTNVEAPARQGFFFHGADQGSHVMLLDGADVLPAMFNNNSFTNFSVNAIADTRVTTAIADASAPLGVGAVTNVVTRSGTNELSGAAFLAYRHRGWNASNVDGGTSADSSLVQPDVALGGAIVRDRLWFFGSYQRRQAATGIARSAETLANLAAADPSFALFDNENEASFLFGKVTHRLRSGEVGFSTQYDRNPSFSDSFEAASPMSRIVVGGPLLSGQLSLALLPRLQARVVASFNAKRIETELVQPSLPSRKVYAGTTMTGGQLAGVSLLGVANNLGRETSSPDSKTTVAADLSTHGDALGSHDLRFGAFFQHNREIRRETLANDGFFLVDEVLSSASDGSRGSQPFHQRRGSPDSLLLADERARDVAVYVQDVWHPHDRVAVTGGLRLDWISRSDLLFDAGNQRSTAVGPRFGLTVALDAARRNILHAAVGRIHDAVSRTRNTGVGTARATIEDVYDLDLDGVFETSFVTPGTSEASSARRIDPDLRQPHVNDVSVGYRRQIADRTTMDITWLRREFRDQLTDLEMNAVYEDNVFRGYGDETQNEIALVTNNRWNWPVYNDVTVQVNHSTARVQAVTSYTRQWQRLAGAWQPNDPFSILQPDAFPDERANPNNWRDHSIRVAGNASFGWGVRLAADYSHQWGIWSGPITTLIPTPDPAFGPPTLTLSNGRVVSNPLATTTRFAYATRGDGQLRSAPLRVANLTVAKALVMPRATLEVSLSVFNLFNAAGHQAFVSTNLAGPTFGQPRSFQLPRAAQLGIRTTF